MAMPSWGTRLSRCPGGDAVRTEPWREVQDVPGTRGRGRLRILAVYFVVVLGIGFVARRQVHTGLDFFLSGRSLPAWITGLAFIAANLGALEILGLAANGAKYGVATVHFYWIGAIPAMVFLGIVMMPFYYNSKVRSVPEYLRLRFNDPTHVLNSLSFAVATVLIAGVNLFAMALVIRLLLGWPIPISIVLAAFMAGVAANVTAFNTVLRGPVGQLARQADWGSAMAYNFVGFRLRRLGYKGQPAGRAICSSG
jgi:uncharacterized sodium:solute symporter family permease YidK